MAYALTNYDGSLKDERYATHDEALEDLCGKYLFTSYDGTVV